jgi:metal-responsive CopG/Arc/MetJ family transcriptional regulator
MNARAPEEKLTELVGVKFTAAEIKEIDLLLVDGGYRSRAELIRSIIREVIRDERASEAA